MVAKRVARHCQIRFGTVKNQIQEKTRIGFQRADQVILLGKRDQNIFNSVVQFQVVRHFQLGFHYLRIPGSGHLQVNGIAIAAHAPRRADRVCKGFAGNVGLLEIGGLPCG